MPIENGKGRAMHERMRISGAAAALLGALALAGCAVPGGEPLEERFEEPADFEGLDIQTWQTGNGAKVLFVEARELPMVDLRVVFDAGSARDGARPGLARLTAVLLDEGAGDLDADAIARRFDEVGAGFGVRVGRDTASVSLRSLTDAELLRPALDTFATVLAEPGFGEDAFERERRRTLVALQNLEQNPGDLAERAFYEQLYGRHPYATPELGRTGTVRALNPADVRAFHERHYVGRNAVVAIVGALSRKEAERLAEQAVGRLPAGEAAAPLPEAKRLLSAPRTVQVEHPSAQTHLWVGQGGMRRGDPDYFPLYVGNHILGGSGFGSRVLDEVREQRGLAYSAYSYFRPLAVEGPFIMGLQTQRSQADDARQVLQQTLGAFVAEGPTEEELEDAKRNITGGFPLRVDSNSDILAYLAVIGFYDLPLDYLQTFNDNVMAVTAEQIRDAFSRHIQPDRLLTVQVGAGAED